MNIAFAKYHGLGNDFLIVDLRDASAELTAAGQAPTFAKAACDRQFGVGGDGILAVLPAVTPGAVARMRVINSDGSEAEMCGNGIRCFAKYLYDRGGVRQTQMLIDTGAGPLACDLRIEGGVATEVTVDMGRPRMAASEIPLAAPGHDQAARFVDTPIEANGHKFPMTTVSMGNPHAVTFVESRAAAKQFAFAQGTLFENHAWFPRRTNVEFAHVRASGDIDLIVWERGCGITLACGTGACATAVAACLTGRAKPGVDIPVHLLGGSLAIRVDPEYKTVWMRGPATFVYDGVIDDQAAIGNARPAL